MDILITGFAPFGGENINPSFEAIKKLPNEIGKYCLIKKEIPVVFRESLTVLKKHIETYQPDLVICVGQAGGRFGITLERIAINIDDAPIADNAGYQPLDEVIFKDGTTAYFSTLPIKYMMENIKKAGIPATISNTAGTYVCNHLMYGLMYLIDKKYPHIRGGFIHVPFTTAQVLDKPSSPALSLNEISQALEVAIQTAIEHKQDLKILGGQTN